MVQVPVQKTREETYQVCVPYTEQVEQAYTVQVPHTTMRTQSYQVCVPYTETVTQNYTVQVPYQEHVLPMIPSGATVDDMIIQ